MNRLPLTLSLVTVTSLLAYFFGKDFVRSEHYQLFWVLQSISLLFVGAFFWKSKRRATGASSLFVGFGIGWLVSIVVLSAILFMADANLLEDSQYAVSRFGWFEAITYWLTISFLHLGWMPYLVLFATNAYFERRIMDRDLMDR